MLIDDTDNNFNNLIFDIKCHIAKFDQESWYVLYLYDADFRKYAVTEQGIKLFKELFTKCIINEELKRTEYRLLGKLHRDNDKPAVICTDGSQFWYQNGNLYRDNDLPTIIYADGKQVWYKNGKNTPRYYVF